MKKIGRLLYGLFSDLIYFWKMLTAFYEQKSFLLIFKRERVFISGYQYLNIKQEAPHLKKEVKNSKRGFSCFWGGCNF